MKYNIYNEDSLKLMDKMIKENIKVDCIITDPPYKLTSRGHKSSGTGGFMKDHVNERLGFEIPHISKWIKKCYDVLKEGTHAYFMTNDKNLFEFGNEILKAGFKISKVLIWEKPNTIPTQFYLTKKEYIIFARKGKAKKINNNSTLDIIKTPNFKKHKNNGKNLHNSEKPTELMEILINNSSNENDIVLDPFMGSGTTGIAALKNNRRFLGSELNEDYFKIAKTRIEKENKCK